MSSSLWREEDLEILRLQCLHNPSFSFRDHPAFLREEQSQVPTLVVEEDWLRMSSEIKWTAKVSHGETYTFRLVAQSRPGAHHGAGGRPRAMTSSELQQSIQPQIATNLLRFLIARCDGSIETLSYRLKEAFLDMFRNSPGMSAIAVPEDYSARFEDCWNPILTVPVKSGYEILPVPFLTVCFKVPRSGDINSGSGNSMDRYYTCTWLDTKGEVHCTCVGSTRYRISIDHGQTPESRNCAHSRGFITILEAISISFNVDSFASGRILSRFMIMLFSSRIALSQYTASLPKLHFAHNGTVIVMASEENTRTSSGVLFVPVRHIRKGSTRYVCTFCDNVLHGNCHHTRAIPMLMTEQESVPNVEPCANDQEVTEELSKCISYLPLAPVSCRRALEVDAYVCQLARASQIYILKAPVRCNRCGSARRHGSQHWFDKGVLMCTIGPCRMVTEQFQCSSDQCGERFVAEGREQCIALDTVTTAATHALLRRELYGVVSSNGTITGRLRQFHSLVTANSYFEIIPKDPSCRSVKTMLRLCSLMLKLMCISPSKSLFHCNSCEIDDQKRRKPLLALCMDGISQGFVRKSSRPFSNVSEKCSSLKPSTGNSRGGSQSSMRPLISLVRETKPVAILFDAIKGKELFCNTLTVKDFACAIRMVSDSAIPTDFCSGYSVCGRGRGDYFADIGQNSTLMNIRSFLASVFDQPTLLLRLLRPLHAQVQQEDLRMFIQAAMSAAESVTAATIPENKTCWAQDSSCGNAGYVQNDIFDLVRLLIQGPVIQFVKKSDATSLKALAKYCCEDYPDNLLLALQKPEVLLTGSNASDTNILLSLNTLRAGIYSLTTIVREKDTPNARKTFGALLMSCHTLVIRFHSFYSSSSRKEDAFTFCSRWKSTDPVEVRLLMKNRYGESLLLNGNQIDLALRTGAYFPGRPQLRPLPFNDEEESPTDFERFHTCSKDFLQRQKSFTPGALTFCCSCSRPKILGFKVLNRNEGPRAILDTVVSRFGSFPKHLIYDFCCGLFLSAVHCLWWVIADLYIVCDHFHYRNHSCSPAYSPRVHTALHATNTLAHEQRNRAISRLGLSLRNCNQILYVSLLAYQAIVLNIRAQAKGTTTFAGRSKLLSDYDIEWCYFECLHLDCTCCPS